MPGLRTDGEIVETLKLIKKYGTAAAAAKFLGAPASSIRAVLTDARTRKLTADSKVVDNEARLTTKVKLLERELAAVKKDNISVDEIRRTIYGLSELVPDPPSWLEPERPQGGIPGVPMTMWSDFHWGERVSKEEVGGVNTFDRKIAKERLQRLVNVTIDLAKHHMVNPKYPGIVICLGGDMITGGIHDELKDTNDGYVQQSLLEVQEELIAALDKMASVFGRVFVPCVVGNHGRETLRPRMKGRVYTSYEWNLYCQIERHFKNDKRFLFCIPGETDCYFKVLGHRFLLTHGDALGVKGGDGIIGAIGPIARGATKVGRSEAQIGRDFDTLLMGHWHTYIPRGDATPVIVNGALKGYDEYARVGLRVPYSRPSQALWFVHRKYGITAQWQVYLDDKRKSADSAKWVMFEQRSKE